MVERDERMKEILGHYHCPRGDQCPKETCWFHHESTWMLGRAFQKIGSKPENFPQSLCLSHAENGLCREARLIAVSRKEESFFSCPLGYHPTLDQFKNLTDFFKNLSTEIHRRMGPKLSHCPICKLSQSVYLSGVMSHCHCLYHLDCISLAFLQEDSVKCGACGIESTSFSPSTRTNLPDPDNAAVKELDFYSSMSGFLNFINKKIRSDYEDEELCKNFSKEALKSKFKEFVGKEKYDRIVQCLNEV